MTQFEMTEKLSEKMNVSLAEAKTALEAGNWNMLTATHLMDQEKFRRMQELEAFTSGGEAMAVQTAAEEAPMDEQPAAAEKEEAAPRAASEKRCRRQGLRNLGDHIRRLVACGNRNRLEIRKDGNLVLELPVTVLALLLLCAFWVCVPLLAVGLFTGCRYSISGRELGREGVNHALSRVSDAAEHMKKTVAEA